MATAMKRTYELGIVLAVLVLPSPSFGGDASKVMTSKEECDVLVNVVVPVARQMLSQHHGFFPFGATMSPSGAVSHTETPKGDRPLSELVVLIEEGSVDGGRQGRYKATALVLDVATIPPGKKGKQRAVEVRLDHRGNYSVRVVFPYGYSLSGELAFEPPFAVPGDKMIFGPSAEPTKRPAR
jgi:hypothetical protein